MFSTTKLLFLNGHQCLKILTLVDGLKCWLNTTLTLFCGEKKDTALKIFFKIL